MNNRDRIVAINPEQRLTRQTLHRIAAQRVAAKQAIREKGRLKDTTSFTFEKVQPILRKSQRIKNSTGQSYKGSNSESTGKIINNKIDSIKRRIILRIFLSKQVSETHFIDSADA